MTYNQQVNESFGYRVAGVLLKDEKILLFTEKLIDFWVLPGGGVKLFESSEEAIKREFLEEIGINVEVVRLLWIVENSFEMDNERVHGIELTFLVKSLDSEDKLAQEEFHGSENDLAMHEDYKGRYLNKKNLKLTFRWFDPKELATITIKPDIYKEALKNIPEHPVLLRNLEIKK
ncbi:MAG: NUDIX domain-containing protein [Asgard group archaeon]|nr:NUDIX domain-containing protein [Asgard group archaeon]